MSALKEKTCDKKLKLAELKILKILTKIESLKVEDSYVSRLKIQRKWGNIRILNIGFNQIFAGVVGVILLVTGLMWAYFKLSSETTILKPLTRRQTDPRGQSFPIFNFNASVGRCARALSMRMRLSETYGRRKVSGSIGDLFLRILPKIYVKFSLENLRENCYLQLPLLPRTAFRPPEKCIMCVGVDGVTRLTNATAAEFEVQFAVASRPVIVTDATHHWRAMKEFNYKFFVDFYRNSKMGKRINECFFFAYKSGLNSLNEVFRMDEKRANLTGEPWYVGWSTCYEEETRKLRSYYTRPYFLPKNTESDMVDWIFMGGPGQGAHMHVDSVRHMSWQAQIRGQKQWQLAPPPECLYQCQWLSFTVRPGEILVVDTNRWYHKTEVLPGDISITIGAEFD